MLGFELIGTGSYIVLSYKDSNGKRKTKWEAAGLPVKKNAVPITTAASYRGMAEHGFSPCFRKRCNPVGLTPAQPEG